ncbi:MAG: alkaline phosphatase D family protein [Rubricoccaceae bacterium]
MRRVLLSPVFLFTLLLAASASGSGCAAVVGTAATSPAARAAVEQAVEAALVRSGAARPATLAGGGATVVPAIPPAVQAGPMLGYVTHREASVWVQTTAPARVQVRYAVAEVGGQPLGAGLRAEPLTTEPVLTGPEGDYVALFRLTRLEPGTTYTYAVLLDGEEVPLAHPARIRTQPLWQWRTDPPAFTVAIGSCHYANDAPYDRPGGPYGGPTAIFERIADQNPDAMVWLGDNVYLREVDWWTADGLNYRHAHARREPALQRLLASTPQYATWDDHDFGPNDSDRSYALKGAALEAFTRYWPAASRGLPGVPGVFTQFQYGDAEFFLLDNRYHRSPNATPADAGRTILGEEQLTWLLDALTFSRAPFKIVGMGGQFLNTIPVFENYVNVAPEERAFILREIERRGIEGVVFISGDRHHAELLRLERPGAYPLYEFTSSPLTAGASTLATRADSPERDNPLRVPGTLVAGQRNFGTLSFEGPRTDRTLTLRAFDAEGNRLWEHRVTQAELRMPPARATAPPNPVGQ